MTAAEVLPLTLYLPVLAFAAASDVRKLRIPNWTALAGIAFFGLTLPLVGWPEAGWRLLDAGTIFALGFGLWVLGLLGAGDVKLLSALLLLVPSTQAAAFAFTFAGAMMLCLTVMVTLQWSRALQSTGWVSMRAHGHFPMATAIALAAPVHLLAMLAIA
ncbi:prepilin peptidase [Wenxinia marina]|uniref:Flp pilus assembly protein, protease CpaA n=1 Tax=Wenxinia marina DSM 24838 TaxID=1123501 RepID=A0A0D0PD76_9RHOB|nr:prepilin peptidase [Wenxinia marina]KIQ69426.1 Flp pilus assembly protein, protease CpaA [Wenxinia marina DSM 24838]GGL58236.1 hypothetical protein GCM10011392_10850 [Wenxinia marina]